MNQPFRQSNRIGELTVNGSTGDFVLLRFSGSDYLNDLFEYKVEALSTTPNFNFDKILGTSANVRLKTQKHGDRYFDGIITASHWVGVGENGNVYELTLRPWLYLASKRRNQRIFHNMTAPAIIEEVLKSYGHKLQVIPRGNYPELEYTVQYGESDLNFVRRIMERFGISFHFTFDQSGHAMVVTDSEEDHGMIPGDEREFLGVTGEHQGDEEHFWEWYPKRNLTTGAIRLTDYNFKTPTVMMETDHIGGAVHANGEIESFDFPGDYLDPDQSEIVVRLRMDQERVKDNYHAASGNVRSLSGGLRVQLTGKQEEGVAHERYVCVRATHTYASESYGSGGGSMGEIVYEGSYEMMPVSAPLVPERKTPLPQMPSPQTAVVVGSGEIDSDEFGRILVNFPWALDGTYSMRCRVSQTWAGNGFGAMVIPRIGMEVLVEFICGNPDYPIVTGCVYNGRNMPPYDLPEHQTRSTFKTDSSVGTGFNELRFEDKKGDEEIFIHAQKDLNTKVENHRTERVNANHVETIGKHKVGEVGSDWIQGVNGDFNLTIGPGAMGTADQSGCNDDPEGIRGAGTGHSDTDNEGSYNLTVANSKNQSIGEMHTETVGATKQTTVTNDYEVDVGEKLTMIAGDEIAFVCGNAIIRMKSNGDIDISGSNINIDGSATIKVRGQMIKLN